MKSGQSILDVYVNTNAIETAKKALQVGSTKLPVTCVVSQEKLITQAPQAAA
jgi:ribosomal protein L16/L10AE